MTEENQPEAGLRASDADRDRVAELLGEALADGRLTAEEHKERLGRLYASRMHADLAPLTADLGTGGRDVERRRSGRLVPVERVQPQVAILSSSMSRPTGRVEGGMDALGLLGNARIDLSHATIDEGGVEITASAIVGAVDIVVPADARVKMTGFPLVGSLSPTVQPGPVDGPHVDVKAFALLGSVTIHRAKSQDAEN